VEFILVDTTDNRKVKQLIVLGNGFDLTCGLKSQYSDFYKTTNIDRDYNALIHYAHSTMNNNPNWADVESNLLELLKKIKTCHPVEQSSELVPFVMENLESKYNRDGTIKIFNTENDSLVTSVCYEYLIKEVSDFENELSSYLSTQIDETYLENNKKLAVSLSLAEYRNDLLFADDDERNDKFEERNKLMSSGKYAADFFTFNYTPVSSGAKAHQIQNIHGSIGEENTILGIDGHEVDDDLLEFTKTYRLLSHSQVKERIDFSQEFDCIKFFGHSLGEADYSYFQSIFDGLDLYKSNTKLFFYFHIYDLSKKSKIIAENYHAVSKLLKHYGETFKSNPDHGKNLMHKLILEGRLTVKELNCSLLRK